MPSFEDVYDIYVFFCAINCNWDFLFCFPFLNFIQAFFFLTERYERCCAKRTENWEGEKDPFCAHFLSRCAMHKSSMISVSRLSISKIVGPVWTIRVWRKTEFSQHRQCQCQQRERKVFIIFDNSTRKRNFFLFFLLFYVSSITILHRYCFPGTGLLDFALPKKTLLQPRI